MALHEAPRRSLDLLVNLLQSVEEIEAALRAAGVSAAEIRALEAWGRHRAAADRAGMDPCRLFREQGLRRLAARE